MGHIRAGPAGPRPPLPSYPACGHAGGGLVVIVVVCCPACGKQTVFGCPLPPNTNCRCVRAYRRIAVCLFRLYQGTHSFCGPCGRSDTAILAQYSKLDFPRSCRFLSISPASFSNSAISFTSFCLHSQARIALLSQIQSMKKHPAIFTSRTLSLP